MSRVKRSTNAQPRSLQIMPAEGTALPPEQHRSALTDLVERMMADVVLTHVPGQRVLDLGRGIPRLAEWVEPRAASLTVLDASDLSRRAQVVLPSPEASVDVLYCVRTFSHLGHDDESSQEAARTALHEVFRVLRNNGTALIQFDNPRSVWGLYHGLRNPVTIVEQGPLVVDSERGITRFDTLGRFKRMLPRGLHVAGVHGMRVAAHAPSLLRIPIVGGLLERFEWFARDRRLLCVFGAHVLIELRKIG